MNPIDNSHFFSPKGRIGRVQYLVTVLIAVAFYVLLTFGVVAIIDKIYGQNEVIDGVIIVISFIPAAVLVVFAGLKRCHDAGVDWWYAIIPILLIFVTGLPVLMIGAVAFFFLFFQKSIDGLNEFGTEPLKPYLPQIEWKEEKQSDC